MRVFAILILLSASAFGQVATDNFTGTSGQSIIVGTGQGTGNWRRSGYSSAGPYTYNASNQASAVATTNLGAVWGGAGTFSNDQYSQVNLVSTSNTARYGGVVVRGTAGTTSATKNFYFLYCSSSTCSAGKYVANTVTNFFSGVAHGQSLPTVVRIEVVGTTVSFKVNGTTPSGMESVTDTSLSTGKPGVIASSGAAAGAVIDDWAGGDVGAADPPIISPASGTYYFVAQSISMSNCTGTTYYTTDGSTPTHSSSTYSAPFDSASSGTQTIKALCYTTGDSAVTTNTYTISNPADISKATDDFTTYFDEGADSITVPGTLLDSVWTSGKWTANTVYKLTASRTAVPVTSIKAGGSGLGNTAGTSASDNWAIATYTGLLDFPADQYAKGKVNLLNGANGAGLCVRCSISGANTGYVFYVQQGGGGYLVKRAAGVLTTLKQTTGLTVADGSLLELKIIGSTIQPYIDGSPIAALAASDSAIASGAPGIIAYANYDRGSSFTSTVSKVPNEGIYEFEAGVFTPVTLSPYTPDAPTTPDYSHALDATWTGLVSPTGELQNNFPWISGLFYNLLSGSPVTYWTSPIVGYTNDSISGIGLDWGSSFGGATTMQYRATFGDAQWEQVKITADTSRPGLNNWFLMMKSQLKVPGHAVGGECDLQDTEATCFDHIAYYVGVQPMNNNVYINGRESTCTAFGGVKVEYSCDPFLHITKVTPPASPADEVVTVTASQYTPMAGDYVRSEYANGCLRAYCKGNASNNSWAATTAVAKGHHIVVNGSRWIVKTAGTTGGSQPSWPGNPSWDVVDEGTTVADGTATWMWYGLACPTTASFTNVINIADVDLNGLGGFPGLFLGGTADKAGTDAGWPAHAKAVPYFTDWSAGTLAPEDYGTCSAAKAIAASWIFDLDNIAPADPFAAYLVDTTGMTPITGPTNITASGNYFIQDSFSCEGTCITVNANDVNIYLQGKTLTYGTNPATFTTVDSDGATITVGSPSEQALPRPGTTTTDGSFATVTDISNTITCSDSTTKTRGVNYRLGVDSYTGDPRGFIWMSGKPAVGVTCTIPSYTYTYPRFGIYNSTWDTYTRATGNATGGGNGMLLQGGTIQPDVNAPAFNMPIWVSNHTTPTIKGVVAYGRGWSAPAIGLSYVAGATVQNNTVSCDSATSGVFNRNQYEGYCIWNKNNSTALSGQKSIFSGNTVLDSVQGGITQDQDNSEIYGNTITTRSRYTNDFAINAQRTGTKVYNNTINNYSATDDEVSGRGVRAATNGEIYSNVIKVHGAPNNYEYGGCQAGDVYGIQAEGVTGTSIHDNQIFAYARTCDARGLRITSTGGITVTNNTIKALRHDSSSTGVAIGISAREAIGTTVGSNTIESDTWVIEDESQTTASNPSNITYRGTTFKKGPTPAAGFHTWSPQNYAQVAATSATHTAIDVQVENGASLSDVTAHAITSYWKQYDIWVKWTYTVNVKVSGVNTSGFLVTLTDAQSNQYQGTTDASGNAAIEVPQYRFYNTAGAAVNTENHNAYSLSITKAGCSTVNASGINVTGTTTDNRTTTCP
jgi:hypothetical protein